MGILLALIVGPVLVSVALLAAARFWVGSPWRDKVLSAVPLAAAALVVLGLVALLPWAGSDLSLSIHWLPGAGRMVIGLGATGLYVALATTGACVLALWGERSPWNALSRESARARGAPWMGALTLLSIAAALVAFLAEHFLARYVALEIVALCIALAPLVELRLITSEHGDGEPAGSERSGGERGDAAGSLARLVYLVLRLGDVGLLVAILVLWSAGGTLDIAPALEAGQALDVMRLNWVVAGFGLAVWVKVGGWPFHLWQQVGRPMSLFSHSWLYATLMPNLGLYLLYRVTPLLVQAGAMQRAAYWMGAVGAALAAVLALVTVRSGPRSTLVYLGAALGGLALVLAAAGLKTAVWMTALVLTPLRLLFYLAGDAALADPSSLLPGRTRPARAIVVGFYALGGLALTGYCLLCAWWMRQAGAPLAVRLVAEFAAAAIGIWAVHSAWLLWRPPARPENDVQGIPGLRRPESARLWSALVLLGGIVLPGTLFFGPLTGYLAAVARSKPLPLPTTLELGRYLATAPAVWVAIVLAVAGRRLFLRPARVLPDVLASTASGNPRPGFQGPGRQALSLEDGLAQAAQILSSVIEVGIQERILGGIVRAVLGSARATRRVVEQQILGGAIRWVSEFTVGSGRLAYRVLEQEGLEGLLRGTVRGVLVGGRWMQRWHTGRLRRNLLWVAATLILAIAALAFYGW